jgi:hypothetical protein
VDLALGLNAKARGSIFVCFGIGAIGGKLNLKLAYGLYLDKVGNMPPVAIAKGIVDAAA